MCGCYDSCRTGNLEALKRYFDFNSNNNRPPTIECLHQCLYLASSRGHLQIVKYLVEDWKVNPYIRDNEFIQIAGAFNHIAVVEYLTQSLGGVENIAK
jgi:hypothetical protein